MPTGEQKQKQRTFDALPKPDKLIRYRQELSSFPFGRPSQPECRSRQNVVKGGERTIVGALQP